MAAPEPLATQRARITIPVAVSLDALRKLAEEHTPEAYTVSVSEPGLGLKVEGEVNLRRNAMAVGGSENRLTFSTTWSGSVNGSAKLGPIELAPVGLNLATEFISAISVTTNLELRTLTVAKGEVLGIQPRGLPVEKVPLVGKYVRARVADERLLPLLEEKAREIDAGIALDTRLKDGLQQHLQALSEGVQIASEPEVWLQVRPSVLRVSRPRIANDKLVCNFGVDAVVTVSLNRPAASTPLGQLPVVTDDSAPKLTVVNMRLHAGFPEWTALLRPRVVGLEQEVGLGTTVEIKDAELTGEGKVVGVRLQVRSRGRVNASAQLTLIGVPRFDPATQEVWLEGLDFDLQTKHLPVKLAEVFLHDWLRKRVAEAARYGLAPELADYKRMANAEGRNREVFPGVVFNGKLDKLAVSEVRAQPQGVAIALLLSGRAGFVIQDISP